MIHRVLRSGLRAILSTIELVPDDKTLHRGVEEWAVGDNGLDTYEARAQKFFEEACTLAHASGLSVDDMLAQVEHEFDRGPVPSMDVAVGEAGLSLSVLSAAYGIDATEASLRKLNKILENRN